MAEFKPGVLTAKGLALLAKWQLGRCTPTVTRAVIGSGSYGASEVITTRTALKAQKLSVGISTKYIQNASTVMLKAIFDNTTLSTGFKVTEIGVYAMDPDDGEILYSLAVSTDESLADYLPAYNGSYPSNIVFNYQIEVSNAETVTIQAGSGAYAPADDFNALQDHVGELTIQHEALVDAVFSTETGTTTLTNTKAYPFNNSKKTVAISNTRQTLFYDVEVEVTAYSGGLPGNLVVSDKQLNGFKLEFDGSAKSVTVAYKIKEGMTV